MTTWLRDESIEDWGALAHLLEDVAADAGGRILALRHELGDVSIKRDGSPVTRADREAEAIIASALRDKASGIAVVSEENADSHKQSPERRFFLVDPLDGTKEFVRRNGEGAFTVNIALIEEGMPIAGVVYAPAMDRMFGGYAGGGAWEGTGDKRREISVRDLQEDGLTAVASRSHRDRETVAWLKKHRIVQEVVIGSSLKFCLVACGEADVYPRFGPTMEWDTAAGDAILRAAGGRVLGLDGNTLLYGKEAYHNAGFVAWGGKSRD